MEENDNNLTEQQVWDVIEFARSMAGMYGANYLNPDLVSGRMRDITLNPVAAAEDTLNTAMRDPKAHELQLQEFSQSFELTSMVYKRLISYLANMLSFDITYISNAKPEDYKTPKYKKDLDAIEGFLEKFDYRRELRIAVREMLRNDAYFGVFRNTGSRYVLQELPPEYCKITGRWDGGFLFSFNMYWFLLPGVDLDMYPDFFKKKYKDIWVNPNTTGKYNPALPPELRGSSSWVYWVDVPVDVGVCFKLSPELATRMPYFSPLFSDLLLQPLMRNLQKNVNMATANRMIVGEVPLLNRDIKATVKDSIAISPDLLGKFMALVRTAITEAIKVASAPLTNIQGISFDAENDLYDSYLRTALASSGINTNLIFTSNVKPNAIETQLSLNVDEQMMYGLYEQFEEFMNYFANKMTRTFKFSFSFEGTDFYLNREQRFTRVMTLFDKGILLPQKIAAALGMKPAQFRKQMEEAAAMDFVGKLTPPALEGQKQVLEIQGEQSSELADKQSEIAIKKATMPTTKAQEESSKGRPKKSDSQIGDEGLATREQATNVGRGGKS